MKKGQKHVKISGLKSFHRHLYMNDPNDLRTQVIELIRQNIQLPPDQQRFWQLFVAYKAIPDQLTQLEEIFGRFPAKIPEILAKKISTSEHNRNITNQFITQLGTKYRLAKTNAKRQAASVHK